LHWASNLAAVPKLGFRPFGRRCVRLRFPRRHYDAERANVIEVLAYPTTSLLVRTFAGLGFDRRVRSLLLVRKDAPLGDIDFEAGKRLIVV
jgi:hypothetical protein